MKKIISFITTLLLLIALSASASALSISVSSIQIGSLVKSVWSVDGKQFTLTGKNYKTIKTSDGKYTFYADGTYHMGDHSAKKYMKSVKVWYNEDEEQKKGKVLWLGVVNSEILPNDSDYDWDSFWIPTKDLIIRSKDEKDDSQPSFAFIKCDKTAALRVKGNKDAKKILDCQDNQLVVVYSISNGYAHINYDGFDGYVKEKLIEFVDLPESTETAVLTEKTRALHRPDDSSTKYETYKEGTEVSVIGEYGDWYECASGAVRFYIPMNKAEIKNNQ